MLIDDFMPVFEFGETQEIAVAAGRDAVFRAIKSFDMNESTTIRWMFKLRGISAETITLRDLETVNFKILGERENQELIVGLAGKFEKLGDKLLDIEPADFSGFREPGFIKATWNFSVAENGANGSRVVSEIRINTTDAKARAKVEKYWGMIKPPLEMIRKEILKIIKKQAERDGKS